MFFAPKTCKSLFDRPRIYYILIIPWISGFFVDGGYIFIGNCFKSYNHVGFNFWYDCSANTTTAGLIQRQFQSYFSNGLPLFSLVMYLAVYLKMRRDQQAVMSTHQRVIAMNKSRRERSFLIQALIICLSLAFESFLFQLVPYLARKNIIDWYWVSLSLGWMIIAVASLNPIIYVIFNQTIRGMVFELL
uniref:7TM GPCR serpentine receptor class x (Srx) domain-containing protein n=1 Tax=Plectus sambesii TaxID=2011161 RepID=A0A914XKU3_9BILA